MINVIKEIVENLLARKKMTQLEFGIVESVSPLKIRIDQKKLLEESDLILSHLVKEHELDITVQHKTESIYGSWDTSHNHYGTASKAPIPIDHKHEYKGRKKIVMHYGLEIGEKVVLIRQEGGQTYYILDRVTDPLVKGEWI